MERPLESRLFYSRPIITYLMMMMMMMMAMGRYPDLWFSISLLLLLGRGCSRCPSHASSIVEQKTLAMIKPDGVSGNYTEKIKKIILQSGFSISQEMMIQLDERNATLFYAEHSERTFFHNLVKYITSGPVFLMILEKVNAVADWRALIGPTDARKAKITHPESIRALCGLDSEKNCVHGSDSPQSAAREISFFFGEHFSTGDILKHDEL